MAKTKKLIAVRLPPEHQKILEKEMARTGENQTQVLLRAIEEGLRPGGIDKKTEEAIATLRKQIEILESAKG